MKTEKELLRGRISNDIAEYLARGGVVDRVDYTANRSYLEPPKLTRRQQVRLQKTRNRIRA
jgi:hypothetical protein